MDFKEFFNKKQESLQREYLFRELKAAEGVDFCSNDYLGLAQNEALRKRFVSQLGQFPLGSSGSRLLRGETPFIAGLEDSLARFSLTESALLFSTGYQANLGLFSALMKFNATVFSDEFVHASIIDGIRLAGCEKYVWTHNDLKELEMLLKQKADPAKMNFVVVESVYSMGGDLTPLEAIAEICERYQCQLIVDEAHATGLFGFQGSGRVEELKLKKRVFATIHTGGKALGVSGAWVAGPAELKNLLVNFARPFIYSTAPAFYQQVALKEAITYFTENRDQLIESFFENVYYLQSLLNSQARDLGYTVNAYGSPITAVVVGDNQKALMLMRALAVEGYDVRAIRPPSVPEGQALLRMTVPLLRTREEIVQFYQVFIRCFRQLQ